MVLRLLLVFNWSGRFASSSNIGSIFNKFIVVWILIAAFILRCVIWLSGFTCKFLVRDVTTSIELEYLVRGAPDTIGVIIIWWINLLGRRTSTPTLVFINFCDYLRMIGALKILLIQGFKEIDLLLANYLDFELIHYICRIENLNKLHEILLALVMWIYD